MGLPVGQGLNVGPHKIVKGVTIRAARRPMTEWYKAVNSAGFSVL